MDSESGWHPAFEKLWLPWVIDKNRCFMEITVKGEVLIPAQDEEVYETRKHYYTSHDGLQRIEVRSLSSESDFSNGLWLRRSPDNGRHWDAWENIYDKSFQKSGSDELLIIEPDTEVWNPVFCNYIGIGMHRIYLNGHIEAYARLWEKAENAFIDHVNLYVRTEDQMTPDVRLVKYEAGDEFNIRDVRNTDYLDRNKAYYYGSPVVLACGDIAFPICIPMATCCQMLGIDLLHIFPSCPQIMHGLIVARGIWNTAASRYDLQFSRPVVISDLVSSRGVDEPTLAELPNGRLVVVFRGSNVSSAKWHTRIEPGTPGYKWFTFSDDGGRTFADPVPWHFDDCEVIYSSATISAFIKSEKNSRIYWIGNITSHDVHGNYPRYPLQIAEVDEKWGILKKSTLTVIDTIREGESPLLQLSNFNMIQDRETGLIELYLAKIGQYSSDTHLWRSQTWKYSINVT